ATMEHLHKQLVAIDEAGRRTDCELSLGRNNPMTWAGWAVNYAARHNLVFAENEHAIAFAGFGHRWPTLEVFCKSATTEPWLMTPEERAGVADLVHACHIASGPSIPCNEEWLHRPMDVDVPMPWRIVIKWRVSTLAGFEGGTKIYINTITPQELCELVLHRLEAAQAAGRLAPGIKLGEDIEHAPNKLKYNPAIRQHRAAPLPRWCRTAVTHG